MEQRKKVKRKFTFTLTDKEKFKLGGQLAAMQVNIAQMQDELFGIKKEYRMKIEDKRQEIRQTVDVMITGKEIREVLCEEVMNFDERLVNYVHGGKILESRPMTEAEAQLDFEGLISDAEEFKPKEISCLTCEETFISRAKFQKVCETCKKVEGYRFAREA